MHTRIVIITCLVVLGLTGCDRPVEPAAKPEAVVQQGGPEQAVWMPNDIPVDSYVWLEEIRGERLNGWIEAETRRP